MNAVTIGARGIGRNRRRTIATVGAMGFAGLFCIFYGGLVEGMMGSLERNALRMELGELQIHHPGYRKDPDLYGRVDKSDEIVAALTSKGYGAAPRLYGFGLVAAGVTSAGAQLRGIEPAQEATVTKIGTHLARGSWVDPNDPRGVVIGRRLAKTLRVDIGDELVVLSQAADGSMANELYQVRGVLRPVGEVVDRSGVFMPRETFLGLFALDGGAHEIAIATPGGVELEDAKATVAKIAAGEETQTWRELQPMLSDMLQTNLVAQFFMMLIIYIAIAMVVLNATLMSVFERIREFGVMKALGVTPGQVATIVFVEVTVEAALAGVVAVVVGVPLSMFFASHGIDLSAFMQDVSVMGVAFDPVWYTEPTTLNVVLPVVVLFAVTVLSALYPGIKAAVIRPVEAIYHR